jgi:hypothetical protein
VVEEPEDCAAMKSRRSRFDESGERRAAVRYTVCLRVELWTESSRRGPHPSFYTTRDVSTKGFYFLSPRLFDVGSRVNFRIIFPRELTGGWAELMSGLAKCVRVENVLGTGVGHYGVGAEIESVKVNQTPPRTS